MRVRWTTGAADDLDNSGGTRKDIEFIESEWLKRSETLNSAPSAFLQQLGAACRRFQPDRTGILGISAASHQACGFQSGNDFRHRWRLHLLDSREFRQPHRTREHENRQSRQPRRPHPSALVLFPDTSQEVDGCGVQGVRDSGPLFCTCA